MKVLVKHCIIVFGLLQMTANTTAYSDYFCNIFKSYRIVL